MYYSQLTIQSQSADNVLQSVNNTVTVNWQCFIQSANNRMIYIQLRMLYSQLTIQSQSADNVLISFDDFWLCLSFPLPYSCADDDTVTIRLGADFFRRSSSKLVNRKCPKWFTPNCISYPSSVFQYGHTIIPK